MSKVKTHSLDSKERYKIIGNFFEIISHLKNKKEVVDFFIGLLTPSESLMMARRIQIANKIIEGASYNDIRSQLKVGFSTIYKTDRWLNSDDEQYNNWIKNTIKNKSKNISDTKELNYISLDKYPQHRLLKELLR